MSQANSIPTTKKAKRFTSTDLQQLLLQARAFIALIVVVAVFSFLSEAFLTRPTLLLWLNRWPLTPFWALG
jgi:ribose/xylose/arabinose/galactoside ABC-type transport system permease subunit